MITERITTDPQIMAGKPVVKGTRIPVERVIQHLAENPDVSDVFAAFPHLTIEDVKACLAYAHASEHLEPPPHPNEGSSSQAPCHPPAPPAGLVYQPRGRQRRAVMG